MWKITVHSIFTVHKPKITVHGQWIVPDTCPGKRKKKKKLKMRKEAKRDHGHESKPTLSSWIKLTPLKKNYR